VQDGITSISLPRLVEDRPGAKGSSSQQRHRVRTHRVPLQQGRGIIEDLSLVVGPEKGGLVGRSGTSKSTLVNLHQHFTTSSGRIQSMGGNFGRHAESLRASIGMVTQDTSLLHRSVRDNILYGRPDAADGRRGGAARRALDFIAGLADPRAARLDAHIGDVASNFRVAAPAHRHRPGHAEGCADPDPRRGDVGAGFGSRGCDQENLPADGRQGRGRDRLRLSTIAAMDRLVVMDGEVIEEGTHEELVANGLYAQLWGASRAVSCSMKADGGPRNKPPVSSRRALG
jgi:ATP-binding cassette subfamily B multidrug efflux pump